MALMSDHCPAADVHQRRGRLRTLGPGSGALREGESRDRAMALLKLFVVFQSLSRA